MAARRCPPARRMPGAEGGFVLLMLLVILTLGSLYVFLNNLTPASAANKREQQTQAALAEAREALIGYALRYRDLQGGNAMYGYLPLPDLGSNRNNNGGCTVEGCDANTADFLAAADYDTNGLPPTVVGRFPWRTLGTPPLRDGDGECLWLIVSGSHGRIQRTAPPATPPPMNPDTLADLEVVAAADQATLRSVLTSRHDRPVAIVLAPGAPISGQVRTKSVADDVTECGGNYDAANYLEALPATLDVATAAQRAAVTNRFDGETNAAAGHAGRDELNPDPTLRDAAKPVSINGDIGSAAGVLRKQACPDCVSNDQGSSVVSDLLFSRLRGGKSFRADINSLTDRMVDCLRDQIASGGGLVPAAITGFAAPADKSAGRAPANACYDDTQHPLGYFSNYQELFFVAKPAVGGLTVNGTACDGGVLMYANQRGAGQLRHYNIIAATDLRNLPGNYLEGVNLANFTGVGTVFTGADQLLATSASQTISQDIVRCIPATAALTPVESPVLSPTEQIVQYDPATRTLTLGRLNIDTAHGYPVAALFGCAWQPDPRDIGEGLRSYFKFSFATLGTGVGNTGFVFSMIDAESNTGSPCGAAGSMLGYAGNNTYTPTINFPKLGIEFDQSRNSGYSETSTTFNFGRRDPCGSFFCGGTKGYDSHAAIVYWGSESANATDGVFDPLKDDNVHGYPTTGSVFGTRQPPQNPSDPNAAHPGIAFVNMRTGGDIFHVRVEITPTRHAVADPNEENGKTTLVTNVWIVKEGGTTTNQVAATKNTTRPMSQLEPGFDPTLTDTTDVYDVAGGACTVDADCGTGQHCGSTNQCYRRGFAKVRLGFTNSQRSQDQQITISDLFTTWLH